MLILWRMVGEQLRVGDEIKLTITDADKQNAEIAIVSPKSIAVDREEIYLKKQDKAQSNNKQHHGVSDD